MTSTSIDGPLNTKVELSGFRRVGQRGIAPGIKGELRVIGAADVVRGYGFDVALYPLFSADNKLGRSLMQRYLTNGEHIAGFQNSHYPLADRRFSA